MSLQQTPQRTDEKLRLSVSDVSRQKLMRLNDVQPEATVGALISQIVPALRMPDLDVEGRPLVYQARLEREGRHLHAAEQIGDAVQTDDELIITPNIDAGGRAD